MFKSNPSNILKLYNAEFRSSYILNICLNFITSLEVGGLSKGI